MMKHLRGGVKKGAFDEQAAQTKFDAWKTNKEQGLTAVRAAAAEEAAPAEEAPAEA